MTIKKKEEDKIYSKNTHNQIVEGSLLSSRYQPVPVDTTALGGIGTMVINRSFIIRRTKK